MRRLPGKIPTANSPCTSVSGKATVPISGSVVLRIKPCCSPVSLEGLLDIKAKHNAAKLVVGNTEVGIELKFKHAGYPVLVGTTHVPELNTIEVGLLGFVHNVCLYDSCLHCLSREVSADVLK